LEVAVDLSQEGLSNELISDIHSVRTKFCCTSASHVKCESEGVINHGCNCNSPRSVSEVFTTLLGYTLRSGTEEFGHSEKAHFCLVEDGKVALS